MNGITNKDEPIKKIYWSVYEFSDELHVEPSALRFWEKYFHIRVKRNKHGNRKFDEATKEKFREVYFLLKVKKFKLEGALQELRPLLLRG